MTDATTGGPIEGVRRRLLAVSRRDLLVWATVVNVELGLVVAYFLFTNARLTSPLFTLYGLVWVNVGLFVLARFEVPTGETNTSNGPSVSRGGPFGVRHPLAAGLAGAYLLVLAIAGGTVGVTNPATPAGLSVSLLPPGWGPAVVYGGTGWSAALMPARVIGDLALAYLLYGRLAETSGVGLAGGLGLVSCVSCSFPVIAGTVGAAVGGGGLAASLASGLGYGVSTAVFLLTVCLLWYGPAIAARLAGTATTDR